MTNLRVVPCFGMPSDQIHATEVVSGQLSLEQDACLFFATSDKPFVEIGKGTPTSYYDMEKLKRDGFPVYRRSYGGSGAFIGPDTAFWSFTINKVCLPVGMTTPDFYHWLNQQVVDTLWALGIKAWIRDDLKKTKPNGVCIDLHGRCEIVDKFDSKMHVSVFKEDDTRIHVVGEFIVDHSWANIYRYINASIEPSYDCGSIQNHINSCHAEKILTQFLETLSEQFTIAVSVLSSREQNTIERIAHKFKIQ